jgi:1-aminocyclopropane-1-carboxylate deaminase/D-cysteine desulfhydrase-like pyridoxal-dependent ACC family enzyme
VRPLIFDNYRGKGYDYPTLKSKKAIDYLLAKEGIILDPIYTGKAFAGLMDLLPEFPKDKTIIFIHTGGINFGEYEFF